MDIVIREYKHEDIHCLLKLAEGDWKSAIMSLKASLDNYNGKLDKCFVAEGEGWIVGFVYGFVLPNKILIPEFLYVHPQYRKNNIGRFLIEQLEKESECCISKIFYNVSLHDYYVKQGYIADCRLEVAIKDIS